MARRPAPKKRGATTSRPRRAAPARRSGVPGWLWGLVGLVAGFFLAQHQHGTAPWQEGGDTPLATVMPRPPAGEDATAEPASEEPTMPTFEFYTLLPESEVIAPRGEVADTASPPPTEPARETTGEVADDPIARVIAANTRPEEREAPPAGEAEGAGSGHRYVLQAASFREAGDAERLQQRLRNLSLVARISQVQATGGETWHRVQVGPYTDTRELNRAQDLMNTQGIEPLLIRLQ